MKAIYKNGKIHFDNEAWALIVAHAKKKHLSTKRIIIDALKRGFKRYGKKIQGKR